MLEKHPAAGATIRTHIVREGVVYDDGEVKVTAFAVDHEPVEHAFGYRFECRRPDRRHLRRHAADGEPRAVREGRGRARARGYLPEHFDHVDTPEVAARLKSYHTSAEEAGQLAARAGVKTLVLTHLIPGERRGDVPRARRAEVQREIVVGRDLLRSTGVLSGECVSAEPPPVTRPHRTRASLDGLASTSIYCPAKNTGSPEALSTIEP